MEAIQMKYGVHEYSYATSENVLHWDGTESSRMLEDEFYRYAEIGEEFILHRGIPATLDQIMINTHGDWIAFDFSFQDEIGWSAQKLYTDSEFIEIGTIFGPKPDFAEFVNNFFKFEANGELQTRNVRVSVHPYAMYVRMRVDNYQWNSCGNDFEDESYNDLCDCYEELIQGFDKTEINAFIIGDVRYDIVW